MHDPSVERPRISLIVPAYNEAAELPRLLDTVEAARARFRHGPAAVEVVVADNASTDRTAETARKRGCTVTFVEERSIAAARNGGAAAARGEILAFVDADSRIHANTFDAIDDSMNDARIVAGATGGTMERWSAGIALTYACFLPLAWLTRFDVGVVFCRRADFREIGGYDERRKFAEDVQFLWDLRRLGRRRRQRLARRRDAKVIVSARKFDRYGDWHYFTRMGLLPWLMLFAPSRTTRFAERYWYDDR